MHKSRRLTVESFKVRMKAYFDQLDANNDPDLGIDVEDTQVLVARIEKLERELAKERGDRIHAEDAKESAEDTMVRQHHQLRTAQKEIKRLTGELKIAETDLGIFHKQLDEATAKLEK